MNKWLPWCRYSLSVMRIHHHRHNKHALLYTIIWSLVQDIPLVLVCVYVNSRCRQFPTETYTKIISIRRNANIRRKTKSKCNGREEEFMSFTMFIVWYSSFVCLSLFCMETGILHALALLKGVNAIRERITDLACIILCNACNYDMRRKKPCDFCCQLKAAYEQRNDF